MKVRQLFPAGPTVSVEDLLAHAASAEAAPLRVGDERIGDFLARFARRLLAPAVARRHPELGSLGFFLRPAELARTAERMRAAGGAEALAFPRGRIFHVPPANVDTIFVYSWALAALAGNVNVVRVSARAAGAATAVLEALNETLADADPVVGRTQQMITYGRDDEVTAALSAWSDLRVIWGGDAAVGEIRRHPLGPAARDLTFPDRASYAALSVPGWRAAEPGARRAAVTGFANDVFWFDQAACASPRAVFLVGAPEPAEQVRREFLAELVEVVGARGWRVDAAMAVQKRVSAYGLAATGAAVALEFPDHAVTGVVLAGPESLTRQWLGAGTVPFVTVPDLTDVVPLLGRRDQTFSHFGFTRDELTAFATALGGRGIDRIVPFGAALTFAGVWDGYDLRREFTRLTTVQT
ncbi:MAG TPA: acyl-CoA reductase [Pilimelia sp.]|nr:acyl-CoA reductase [Pilimelia sp.]